MRIARETLTLMGGVRREGHEWEAEVRGADAELELVQGLEEHGQLDVPNSPAHLDEAHVRDLDDDDAPPPLLARCD